MSRAEVVLWERIRRNAVGAHFRRQHPAGPYVLDFVCLSKKVVIEVDGPWHNSDAEEERHRQRVLLDRGFLVLRFTNDEILHRTEQVVELIIEVVRRR